MNATETLRARAEALWNACLRRDCSRILQIYFPQSSSSPELLERCEKDPFKVLDYEILDVQTASNLGWVSVRSKTVHQPTSAEPIELTAWEKWEQIDQVWRPIPPTASPCILRPRRCAI